MKLLKNLVTIAAVIALIFSLAACGDGSNALQKAVDEINEAEANNSAMEGIYNIYAEARDESTMVVVFEAEMPVLANPEVAKDAAEAGAEAFQASVEELRRARVTDPKIILEFLDMEGELIYSREFS